MADKWIDPAATGSNDGSSPANAWTSAIAWISGISDGDKCWVRRTLDYDVGSGISLGGSGSLNNPRSVIGWPRASFTGTGDFTKGSTSVTNVTSPTVSLRRYVGRWIKNTSNGKWYLITNAEDAGTTLVLDRPYGGATATGAGFTVAADEDYASRPQAGIDAGWDSDSQELPQYKGNPTAWMFNFGSYLNWVFKNFYFLKTGAAAYGLMWFNNTVLTPGLNAFLGCVWNTQTNYFSAAIIYSGGYDWLSFGRFIVRGVNYSNQYGIEVGGNNYTYLLTLKDGAIYKTYYGLYLYGNGTSDLHNINLGVEGGNYQDMKLRGIGSTMVGKDVKCGSTSQSDRISILATPAAGQHGNLSAINIENWQKNLAQVYRRDGLDIFSLRIATTATDPILRTGGNDVVLKVDLGTVSSWGPAVELYRGSIMDQRIWQLCTSSRSYRVYLQSTVALASGKVTLEVTYLDSKDADDQYTEKSAIATGAISARTGASDWSQYLEVTGIQPAIHSPIRLRVYVRAYSASNFLYVDPKVDVA